MPNRLLNDTAQRDQTFHEGVNKSKEDHCQQSITVQSDLQSNSKKF